MRESGKFTHTTIIKRHAARSHFRPHTGAWKVAFADFTLALMSLFIVLWIAASISQKDRQQIVMTLNNASMLEGQGESVFDNDAHNAMIDIGMVNNQPIAPVDSILERSKADMDELSRAILKITSENHAQANLQIDIVPQGLRITIRDDRHREMFPRSSAQIGPFFKDLLKKIAPTLNQLNNKIVITGHTDSTQYQSQNRYSNWKLSSDRAVIAQQTLLANGLGEDKVLQVSAMADKLLLKPDQPNAAENRRIEILVLTQTASDSLYQFFGKHGIEVTPARP